MTYLDFLSQLAALGTKLPALFAIILHIVEDVREAIALLTPKQGFTAAAPFEAPASAAAVESNVVAILEADSKGFAAGGLGILAQLREVWVFIQAHPEVMALVLSFFKPKA